MSRRLEIEEAENGFQITFWDDSDKDGDLEMYPQPEKLVAQSFEEVAKIVGEKFKK